MPIIKSAQKRVRQTRVKTIRNLRLKRSIRLATKDFEHELEKIKSDKTKIANIQSKLNSLLDTATKKKVFHKNKTARRKKIMAKKIKDKLSQPKPAAAAKKAATSKKNK